IFLLRASRQIVVISLRLRGSRLPASYPDLTHLTKSRKAFLRGTIISAAVVALLFAALANTPPIRWLEAGTYDVRVRMTAQDQPDSDKVIVVDVDNQSFDALKSKLGRWPWERRVWTAVLQFVQEGKPNAVLYDIIFEGESSDPSIDDRLADEAKKSGDVVLAYAFTGGEGNPKDWA